MKRLFLLAVMLVAGCAADAPAPQPDLSYLAEGVRSALLEAQDRSREALAAARSAAEEADAWGELGRAYHANHLVAAAAESYRQATSVAPGSQRWHYYLAHVERDRGNLDAAESAFRRVIELEPGNRPAAYHLAQLLIDRGKPEPATELLRELDSQGRDAAVLAAIGRALLMQGHYSDAASALERALALQPQATRLHQQAAMAWRGAGDRERAAAHLARAGETDPGFDDPLIRELASLSVSVELYIDRGRAALARGDFRSAEHNFRAAVELDPGDASAHATLALLLQQTGRLDAALESQQRAIGLAPADATQYYLLGTMHERSDDEASAVAAYQQAIDLDPQYPEPNVLLGHAAMRRGEYHEALRYYGDAANAMPQSVVARYHAGLAALAANACDVALSWLDQASELQPGYGPVIMAQVRRNVVCSREDVAGNLQLARQLYQAAPGDDEVSATLALAFAAGGDFDNALRLLPNNEDYRQWREKLAAGELPGSAWPEGAAIFAPPLLRPR